MITLSQLLGELRISPILLGGCEITRQTGMNEMLIVLEIE